ncbi:SdpI family protein [uncultured Flavobacterium sp.]|uniref:SdpI family protein n=1 Tax=uncultured Flavobacterium sp. TaxID=165435 RepID=UPI0025DE6675|nr:SdpI family protein [uncultured Flavobacterium sp.]
MEWIENLNQLPLLTGSIFIIAGFVMYRFPPKKINILYGYRTMNSMKSQERWDFSQKYSSKELMKFGLFLFALSLLGLFNISEGIVNVIVVLFVFLPILTTEIALRRKFTK